MKQKVHVINYEDLVNDIVLKSDIGAEFPVYIYLSKDSKYLLHSRSITALLNDNRVSKPLNISGNSISFYLQSGVVPQPNTIYENIFLLGIGCKVVLSQSSNKIVLDFDIDFPFLNSGRDEEIGEEKLKYDDILELIAEAVMSRIDCNAPSYLFHSAGKDSNTIALALAEGGYEDRVTLISHKSDGAKDESEISKKIAKKLGFKHKKLTEPKQITKRQVQEIYKYFNCSPFPCTDAVALAYPLYQEQIDFKNSNVIDGMGNDVYIGHIPSRKEYYRQKYFSRFSCLRPFTGKLKSTNPLVIATRTKAECTGFLGLSYGDSKKIYKESIDVYPFWNGWSKKYRTLDYFDFRAATRGVIIDQEIYIRKVRNFADINNANLILPWANERVVNYFSKLPEKHLFDRRELKNKLILRKLLKEKIELDSDTLGKMAFEFDTNKILLQMHDVINTELKTCPLWNKLQIKRYLEQNKIDDSGNPTNKHKVFLLNTLFILSAWINGCKYIK